MGLSKANITKHDLAKKIKKHLPNTKIIIKNDRKDPDRDYFIATEKLKKGFKAVYSLDHV